MMPILGRLAAIEAEPTGFLSCTDPCEEVDFEGPAPELDVPIEAEDGMSGDAFLADDDEARDDRVLVDSPCAILELDGTRGLVFGDGVAGGA